MDGSLLLEMAVPCKKAGQQVSGLEWPRNLHLVKLPGLHAEASRILSTGQVPFGLIAEL